MNREQYSELSNIKEIRREVITGSDLTNQEDRTLLFGYTCARETWHVYLKNGDIRIYQYGGWFDNRVERYANYDTDFVPDKRLNPERCDYEFCKLLTLKGVNLPFTTWSDEVEKSNYYGEIAKTEGDAK